MSLSEIPRPLLFHFSTKQRLKSISIFAIVIIIDEDVDGRVQVRAGAAYLTEYAKQATQSLTRIKFRNDQSDSR